MSRLKPQAKQRSNHRPQADAGGLMDRPSRASLFARRQKRLVRPALLGLVLLGVVGGGVELSRVMRDEARFAPIRAKLGVRAALHVTTIDIKGRDMTPEPALMQALGVSVGDDMLGFSVEEARRRIDALPFVERATVERRLPGTIVVRLVERRPFAVWQNQGRFVLIDRNGQVVADQGMNGKDAEAFAQLPLVVGAGAPAAADGLIEALEAEPDVRAHVVAAVRVGGRRWNLTLRNGCDVLLPEGAEPQALHRLALLQHDHQLLVRPLEAIDMRLPDRLVIRPRAASAVDAAATDDAHGDATVNMTDGKADVPPGTATGARSAAGSRATAASATARRTPAPRRTVEPAPAATGDDATDPDAGHGTGQGADRGADRGANRGAEQGRRPA